MIDPTKIKKILKKLSYDDIIYLWEIGQEHDYPNIKKDESWREVDEFWRQAGYEMRERG